MKRSKSFTIIELSIVILIMTLLVSGTLIGRNLIEKAKVQSIITQLTSFKKNYAIFVSAYEKAPGKLDYARCANFQEFNTGSFSACVSLTESDTIVTGNRFETFSSLSALPATFTDSFAGLKSSNVISTGMESVSAIKFMALAKMLDFQIPTSANYQYDATKKYNTGMLASYAQTMYPALNADTKLAIVPVGIVSGLTTPFINYQHLGVSTSDLFYFANKNAIAIINPSSIGTSMVAGMSAIIMSQVDKKIDTGMPYTGNFVVGYDLSNPSNTSGAPTALTTLGRCTGNSTTAAGSIKTISYRFDNTANNYGKTEGCVPFFLLDE